MRPVLLKLDDSLEHQDALAEAARALNGRVVEAGDLGPELRLWSRPSALYAVEARFAEGAERLPELTFAGSGDFHHLTPILLRRAIRSAGHPPVTVIHFDNHPDWVRFEDGMHCGSWVGAAARMTDVWRVITIGACSKDIDRPKAKGADLALVDEGRVEVYPYRAPRGHRSLRVHAREWPTFESIGEAALLQLICERIPTVSVYVTIDKDVLRGEDAATNWDQGCMSLEQLERLVCKVCEGRRLIGADVVGDWSTPHFGGGALASFMKRGEALLDHPHAPRDIAEARALNESVNLRLLDLFQGLSA